MAGRDLKELFRAFRNADELAFRRAANTIIEEEEARHHVGARPVIFGSSSLAAIPSTSVRAMYGSCLRRPTPIRAGTLRQSAAQSATSATSFSGLRFGRRSLSLPRKFPSGNRLEALGVPRRNRVIFYGPPGWREDVRG